MVHAVAFNTLSGPSMSRSVRSAYTRVMAATQLLANYFDGYFRQQGMYLQMWPDRMWKGYIQDHIAKSPALRRYVVDNPTWFASEFVQMCDSSAMSPAPNKA